MSEFFERVWEWFFEANLEKKSGKLLTTFDKTVKGLEQVSENAAKRVATRDLQIENKKAKTEEAIAKVVEKERKAIEKAKEAKEKLENKAKESRDKIVIKKAAEVAQLKDIAAKNVRVAEKLRELID